MASDDVPLTPVKKVAVPPAQQIIIQQPPTAFGRYGKWLLTALAIAVMIIIGLYSSYHSYFSPSDMPREKYHSLAKYAAKKIAIIDISGAILEGEDGFVKKQIDRVREDDSVIAVVLRINSPGGTITGSDYIYHHLRTLVEDRKLPLVVSMGSVCASGGYYIAMAVGSQPDVIYAEPTTWTGSIGVIVPHFDVSGALNTIHVKDDSIASGPLKEMGSPTRPMTDEERKLIQQLVNDSFKDFKDIVVSGRPKFKDNRAALDALATGQIYTAKQALEKGLVDKIGFIESAIARALELAHQNAADVRCVKYEKQPSILGEMFGTQQVAPANGTIDVSAIVDLATPRPYYLWSWLPSMLSNSR
jgi:protease IV